MTDKAWNEGMKDLLANLPGPELSPAMAERRGRSYREDLGHLTDEQWLWTCRQARKTCRFFPVIDELLTIAEQAPRPPGLPPRIATAEEEAEQREALRAARVRNLETGAAVLRAEAKHLGVDLEPLVSMVLGFTWRPHRGEFEHAATTGGRKERRS